MQDLPSHLFNHISLPATLYPTSWRNLALRLFASSICPVELRNEIYVQIFSSHDHVHHLISSISLELNSATPPKDAGPRNNLSLLLTCRRIHTEAALLAFHHTTFITTGRVIDGFFRLHHTPLGPEKLSSITSLTIDLDPRCKPKERRWEQEDRMKRNIAHGIIGCSKLVTSASRCRLVGLKEVTILVVEGVVEREDLYEEMLFDERCSVCEAWREQFGAKCVDEVVQRGDDDKTVELMLSWKMEEDCGELERELRICFQYVGG